AHAAAPNRTLLRPLPSSDRLAYDRQRHSTKSSSPKTTKTEAAVKSLRVQPETCLIFKKDCSEKANWGRLAGRAHWPSVLLPGHPLDCSFGFASMQKLYDDALTLH